MRSRKVRQREKLTGYQGGIKGSEKSAAVRAEVEGSRVDLGGGSRWCHHATVAAVREGADMTELVKGFLEEPFAEKLLIEEGIRRKESSGAHDRPCPADRRFSEHTAVLECVEIRGGEPERPLLWRTTALRRAQLREAVESGIGIGGRRGGITGEGVFGDNPRGQQTMALQLASQPRHEIGVGEGRAEWDEGEGAPGHSAIP